MFRIHVPIGGLLALLVHNAKIVLTRETLQTSPISSSRTQIILLNSRRKPRHTIIESGIEYGTLVYTVGVHRVIKATV